LALKETANSTKHLNKNENYIEWAQKATSIPKTKKKDEPPMKLLNDPKIPQPEEVLKNHTTPTNFSTSPSRRG
jgi:hypothetical protein